MTLLSLADLLADWVGAGGSVNATALRSARVVRVLRLARGHAGIGRTLENIAAAVLQVNARMALQKLCMWSCACPNAAPPLRS